MFSTLICSVPLSVSLYLLGEETFDSLPALFMGSESLYVIVFDLSVMRNTVTAERQYEHITKWAHIIAHQVPTVNNAYFRVILVGTHLDTFPDETVPTDLLTVISDKILRLVGYLLGSHLMRPTDGSNVPFFQVGSSTKVGLGALTQALHDSVRPRTLPLEYVCVQDLLGRAARQNAIPLLSRVAQLDTLELNRDPLITLSALLPDLSSVRTGLVPYLESAADIVVCREDVTGQTLCDSDTIVFDIPRLISAVELLCSVVMARWGWATSARAKEMLAKVIAAGHNVELQQTERVLKRLDASLKRAEEGFPREVAEWLVWTAAKTRSSDPVLVGADVTDTAAFMSCLAHLNLLHCHKDRLLMPMLLPETASFATSPTAPSTAEVFLYQMIETASGDWEALPVSLATFHLVVVALWRASLPDSPIQATQRCTNAMTMDGCVPVRLRLNTEETFIRVELLKDTPAKTVEMTWARLTEQVCESTQSLRWGWRGCAVVVPAHPFPTVDDESRPLFEPDKVAARPMHYREIATVESELARWTGEPSCNASLKQWWVKKPRKIQCKFVFSIDMIVLF